MYNLVGEEYTPITEYKRSAIKVKMRHNKCGNEYYTTPNSFLRGNRCPNCHGNNAKRKTTSQFKEEVYNLVGDEYTVLGEYINRSTPILIKHNKCGREYKVEPGNFLYRSRCIECYYESLRLKPSEINDRLFKKLGKGFVFHSKNKDRLKVLHEDCGNIFTTRLTDIELKGTRCPHCNKSNGENLIESYLVKRGIVYEYQKRFDGLRNIMPLSYDFYLPSFNILIEYQGEQHFRPKTFGGISKEQAHVNFQRQVENDNIKRSYANEHGFTLLEPSYKLNDYEKISKYLDKELKDII